ncbi:hypothetical protein CAC42_3753 [Sphaceloma murrayae]|uniref:Sugar phosphate transporter domain-containing protein n=1 Tax=Sphaceloma murrayae TaxID=2082308 RepID=A0A2K1QH31_9PEZI|nr:hypothetical protein CAC42_3753 [Sphaceloma murrayae]
MTSNGSFTVTDRRSSSSAAQSGRLKFPELTPEQLQDGSAVDDRPYSPTPGPLPDLSRLHSGERWQARKEQSLERVMWSNDRRNTGGTRHGRQKSLSEAIRTVRERRGSVNDAAVEIGAALKAPVSWKLVALCGLWYATSILSNASSKAILTALPKPVTLTVVQFFFVSSWCIFAAFLARVHAPIRTALPVLRNGIRRPDWEIIRATLPLTAFQIGGHILNSDAMSRIPVSLVHTIKGLSPLFTVLAYRFYFGVHYSRATYLSLVPLTLGVVMACSASFRAEFLGLIYAFGSALLFVTQNIVSKTLFTEAAKAEADGLPPRFRKPDKLNLLCYSSGLALLFTLPLWFWSEGLGLIADFFADASVELSGRPGSLDHGRLALEFVFNGTFHFTQSLVAFVLLGLVSPVTYSVASLIKRVFVIVFAVLWFGNTLTGTQASGIALTIVGLYLYDRISDADKADRKLREKSQAGTPLLPVTVNGDAKRSDAMAAQAGWRPSPSPYVNGNGGHAAWNGDKRRESQNESPSGNGWLPPGTKQEETWTQDDVKRNRAIDVR